uniref:Uncharacterized protein n=1 Tax=Globodera rostochiensis TaxID=31243 RepID=A0A914HET0_GLORO
METEEFFLYEKLSAPRQSLAQIRVPAGQIPSVWKTFGALRVQGRSAGLNSAQRRQRAKENWEAKRKPLALPRAQLLEMSAEGQNAENNPEE